MRNRTAHRWIVLYLLVISLVYIPTILLWGNIAGLRALHVDIPPSASDAAFQVKALANFLAGIVMLTGCAGSLRRQDWGRPVTLIDLLFQMDIYVAEIAILRYCPCWARPRWPFRWMRSLSTTSPNIHKEEWNFND